MNPTTKTILIASSLLVVGGIILVVMKNKNKKRGFENEIEKSDEKQNTIVNTSLKGTDLTRGGTHIPTKEEFDAWKKANPLKLTIPTLSELLKGTNWLKIGEQVPRTTTTTLMTTSSNNYGIDQNKLAQWKKELGIK
tara:strand:+ start:8366 stop:8776 length:411 start_codon:yes stop_codon:yes gene_type:complete